MNERTYKTEAIILSRRNFGEADRILTCFSRYHGKLRIIAKGVRRPTSRKRGQLELFNHVKLFIVVGKNLDIVTEAETKNSFSSWRKDLTHVGVAYHLVEVVDKLTAEGESQEEVFYLLRDALEDLNKAGFWDLYKLTQSFKKSLLVELGFLEKERPTPSTMTDLRLTDLQLDDYIEEITGKALKTKRFLKFLV